MALTLNILVYFKRFVLRKQTRLRKNDRDSDKTCSGLLLHQRKRITDGCFSSSCRQLLIRYVYPVCYALA